MHSLFMNTTHGISKIYNKYDIFEPTVLCLIEWIFVYLDVCILYFCWKIALSVMPFFKRVLYFREVLGCHSLEYLQYLLYTAECSLGTLNKTTNNVKLNADYISLHPVITIFKDTHSLADCQSRDTYKPLHENTHQPVPVDPTTVARALSNRDINRGAHCGDKRYSSLSIAFGFPSSIATYIFPPKQYPVIICNGLSKIFLRQHSQMCYLFYTFSPVSHIL